MVALRAIQHPVGSVGGHYIYPGGRQGVATTLYHGHFPSGHQLCDGSTQGSGAKPLLERFGAGDS